MKQTPVVLIHGAWFHRSSWEGWAEQFASHGYAVSVPGWPGEAPTAAGVRRGPGPWHGLGLAALTAHHERIVRSFDDPPVLIGHSAGGLIARLLLGAGLGRAAVALAPLPPGGVRPVEGSPQDGPGPGTEPLTRGRFRHLVANAVGEREAAELFERYAVPAPRPLLADLGFDRPAAGPADTAVDAAADAAVDTAVNTADPARGPLLLVSGQEDRIVPDAVTRAVYKLYGDSPAVTDLKQFADRGHSLVFDGGRRAVADHVLAWLAANGIGAVTQDRARPSGL
ncbi:alpha/beta hydrolase [Kitasatospora sp. NPDC048365]|uniref:alpha/beta hydrolase n=1 Tax=Kitasatospora sp. NPDC048365 TaxID=3364050 RepID=UPI003713DC8F